MLPDQHMRLAGALQMPAQGRQMVGVDFETGAETGVVDRLACVSTRDVGGRRGSGCAAMGFGAPHSRGTAAPTNREGVPILVGAAAAAMTRFGRSAAPVAAAAAPTGVNGHVCMSTLIGG
ncbi:MAG: hypothetical protein PHQ14_09770, partial [Chromatiales bacterium]|nr:hypothetical protein [Chromatiales bacterium]